MKKRTIWTFGYTPFICGGDVNKPISTQVGYVEEKSIGKGLKAFSFYTPNGTIRIAESVTGAIVGDSFEQVKADVASASKKIMLEQIKEAQETVKQCKKLSKEKFFEQYRY